MQKSPNLDPMRPKAKPPQKRKDDVRLVQFSDCVAQTIEYLRGYGVVDPKVIGALVKGRIVEVAIRYNPALDAVEPATLAGFDISQRKKSDPAKSHWQAFVNRHCVVTWHRLETLDSLQAMGVQP